MNQENIGKFIAALRKEKKMTQKQFAEILGVNDRSISRWENGYCMPDLSLLEIISEELDVSVTELLNGRRMNDEGRVEYHDAIGMVIELSNKEKQQKAKKITQYFTGGFLCFAVVILHSQFDILSLIFKDNVEGLLTTALTIFGILLELMGFYHNSQDKMLTPKEIESLLKSKRRGKMNTAKEMLQFAKKYQDIQLKQYEKAFSEISKNLTNGEQVIFAATGSSYARNELPMMWYPALAVTKERLIIVGERSKGMIMVSYSNECFLVSDIVSVQLVNSMIKPTILIQTLKSELKIEEENIEIAETIVNELNKKLITLK